jgi:Pyruvate/2-oxoacid:ferredoxin oxidoreductase delta subunit
MIPANKTVTTAVGHGKRTSRHVNAYLEGRTYTAAHDEARRCLSCGNCNECETCYKYCPNQAILELGDGMRYQIYLGDCIGCGLCAAECPAGAIDMVSEKA